MDALSPEISHFSGAQSYPVFFGGGYRECWSEDYRLSIVYENRRCVEAEPAEDRWRATGGDRELVELLNSPDCPRLTDEYFQAAASVYAAARDCVRRPMP